MWDFQILLKIVNFILLEEDFFMTSDLLQYGSTPRPLVSAPVSYLNLRTGPYLAPAGLLPSSPAQACGKNAPTARFNLFLEHLLSDSNL